MNESPRRLAIAPVIVAAVGILVSVLQVFVAIPSAEASVTYTKATLVTFYGWQDNDPANSAAIAYPAPPCLGNPRVCYTVAQGSGTWTHPVVFAAHAGNITPGARIYLPLIHKYGIIYDTCSGCAQTPWVDVWIGGKGLSASAVDACERALTPDGRVPAIFNPPSNKPVNPRAMVDAGGCHRT